MAQRRRGSRKSSELRQDPSLQAAAIAGAVSRRRRPTGGRIIPRPLLISSLVILAVIVAIVGADWWYSVKRHQDTPVLVVNSRTFRWSDFMSLLRFEKLGTEKTGGKFAAGQEPYNLMNLMTENELIRQAAAREGLKATEAAIRKEMASRLVPNADKVTDPNELERELNVALADYLSAVRLSRAQYEDVVRADIYREQLRDKLGVSIPRVQPQAYIQLIQVPSDGADQAMKDLQAGTPFETVARRVSTDPNVETNGGEIGWVPQLVYPDLDSYLFGLKVGDVSFHIQTRDGYWLVRVLERVEGGAHLQGMLLRDTSSVDAAQRRIRVGASFTDLAAELSVDAVTKAARGDLGLVKVGERGKDFDQLIRGNPVGELIGPVLSTQVGFIVIVKQRTQAQEVSDDNLGKLKQRALNDWLNKERTANYVNYCPGGDANCFGSVKVDRALKELQSISLTGSQEAAATAAAQPPPGGRGGFP